MSVSSIESVSLNYLFFVVLSNFAHKDLQQVNYALSVNSINQFDLEDGQIEADFSLFTEKTFRIEKLRVTRVGKFDKDGVQELLDGWIGHLSDFGSEQNVRLPHRILRGFCKLHCYTNIYSYLTDDTEGYFEFDGRCFNAVLSSRRLVLRLPVIFNTVFRHSIDLPVSWKIFSYNVRLEKYRQLRDFSEARMMNNVDFEVLYHFARLMLVLEAHYLSHFQNLNNAQLLNAFNDTLLRLEHFSLTNRVYRPIQRLKLTIRNNIEMLRINPQLTGIDLYFMSTLIVHETLKLEFARAEMTTVDRVRNFFHLISRGVQFINFNSPFGIFDDVSCVASLDDIDFDENAH